MKYNYLERYNLINIIQEMQASSGLNKIDIEKHLINFKNIENYEDKFEEVFKNLKDSKSFIKRDDVYEKAILYYFFFEKKLYMVKLYNFEENNKSYSDIVFKLSAEFFNKDAKFFLENYKDTNLFNFEAQMLNDSKTFWLKVASIIKTYSDEYKIKYFSFSGSFDKEKQKQSSIAINSAIRSSFENCREYLKANLLKQNPSNLKEKILNNINKYIKRILITLNDITLSIKEEYPIFLKDISKLIDSLEKQASEKEFNAFKTFFKNCNEINTLVLNLDNTNIQELIKLNEILNKAYTQHFVFIKNYENIKNYKNIYEINDDTALFLKIFRSSIKMLKEANTILIFLYKCNNKLNNSNDFKLSDFIKEIEIIFNKSIIENKLDSNESSILKKVRNFILDDEDILGDFTLYSRAKREQFGKALTQALQEVSNEEDTFTLHKDYKNRLELYLKNIPEEFGSSTKMLDFISKMNFNPEYSYFTIEELQNDIPAGWLLSFTYKGLFGLLNSREKKYYNILINDLKIAKEDIIFKNGNLIFKI